MHVTIAIKSVELLNQATLRLRPARRYGIVGRNGVGKSTLLRRIANGSIEGFPEDLRCLHVRQEAGASEQTAFEAVLAADVTRTALLAEEAELMAQEATEETARRLTEVLAELDDIEAETAEERARAILVGLQFSTKKMNMPTKALSGGWRMRVALARALFLRPDMLMLDEPTNHMDLPAVLWLQAYLQTYDGTVIVVSHDKGFLNAVATEIIHFHKQQLFYYPGNYDAFKKARDDKHLKKVHIQHSLDKQRAHWEASVKKMATAAAKNPKDSKRGHQAAVRKKKLQKFGAQKTEDGKKWNCQKHSGMRPGSIVANTGGWKGRKMTRTSIVEAPPPKFSFEFPADFPVSGGGPLLQLRDVSFSYPAATPEEAARRAARAAEIDAEAKLEEAAISAKGPRHHGRKKRKGGMANAKTPRRRGKHLLNNITMDIACRSRVGILGANGAGKSTLLALLTGALTPCSGERLQHRNLKIATFAQHHVDQLKLALTPLEHMCATYPLAKPQELRKHLGGFGLAAGLAVRPMGTLSGGQKSRVVFATITYTSPHMLILDEPTNHLDFSTIDALQDALKAFDGGVVLVSHSQSLIGGLCNVLYEVKRGFVDRVESSFGEWVSEQMRASAASVAATLAATTACEGAVRV